jgi:hypothetical protein
MSDTFGEGIGSMLVVRSDGVSISDVCKLIDLSYQAVSKFQTDRRYGRLTARFQPQRD